MSEKKYIAPGGWFSLNYPEAWNEFEDREGSFLFYNPAKWSGNFRVSAYKDASITYAADCLADEQRQNPQATLVKVGRWECVYSTESFTEEGNNYESHLWLMGQGDTVVECSFTVPTGGSIKEAEQIIASIQLRDANKRYPKEYIPIRVVEIIEVDESFAWATSQLKKLLKVDFNSAAHDIKNIQRVMDSGAFTPNQRDTWSAFGIAFGTILVNEIDGMEWISVIDGQREYPALRFRNTDLVVEVNHLLFDMMRAGGTKSLQQEYEHIREAVEHVL